MDCSKQCDIVDEPAISKAPEAPACESKVGEKKGDIPEVLDQNQATTPVPEWVTCMMGCSKKLDENQQLVLLSCFHVICSDECLAKFKDTKIKEDGPWKCNACSGPIDEQLLDTKITIRSTNLTATTPTIDNVTVVCENCVFDVPAVKMCVDCPILLCSGCADIHLIMRATHFHQLTDDIQKQKRMEVKRLVDLNIKCSVHPEEHTKFRCFTCSIKFCSLCVPSHHGHEFKNLAAGTKDVIKRTDLLQKKNERRVQVALPFLTKQTSPENLAFVYQQMVDPIKEKFQSLLKALIEQYVNCLNKLRKDITYRQECLESTLKRVEECNNQSQRIMTVIENVLKAKNQDRLALVERMLEPLFKAVGTMDTLLDNNMDDLMGLNSVFLVNTDVNNLSMQSVSHYMENKYVHVPETDKTKALKGVKRNSDGEIKGADNKPAMTKQQTNYATNSVCGIQKTASSGKSETSAPVNLFEYGRGFTVIRLETKDKVPEKPRKRIEVIDLEKDANSVSVMGGDKVCVKQQNILLKV